MEFLADGVGVGLAVGPLLSAYLVAVRSPPCGGVLAALGQPRRIGHRALVIAPGGSLTATSDIVSVAVLGYPGSGSEASDLTAALVAAEPPITVPREARTAMGA